MVVHVLVDHSSRDVHSLVVWDLGKDFAEAFKCLLKLVGLVVHQSQMETAAHEVVLQFQCFLVHFNGELDELMVLLSGLFVYLLCLALVCQALCMPQL